MEQLKCNEFDDFVEWKYKQLYVLGVVGRCELPLNIWNQVCANSLIEFAPVKNEKYRDFLAVFDTKTPLDITIVQYYKDNDTSIVIYGVNQQKTREIKDELVQKSGLITIIPNRAFVSQLAMEIRTMNVTAYDMCEKVAQASSVSLETVFGEVHYTNFLMQYKGVNNVKASEDAFHLFRGCK